MSSALIAPVFSTPNERAISGAAAFVMHALFFALLVIGVNWQKKQPDSAMIVDLWNNLPPVAQPKADPAPPPEAKPEPEPPKPAPKVEAKPPPPAPVPKAEPKPAPKPVTKPDIALKEKEDKDRKLKEQAAAAETKKRQEDQARAEAAKQQQAQEAEARRAAQEQADAQKKLAAQAAAAQAKMVDEYKRRIADKIKRFIVEPPGVNPSAQLEFEIVVLPGGEVLGAKLKRATNSIPAYDQAVERAILRAQPLPLPPDPALMKEFRELNLVFRPKE